MVKILDMGYGNPGFIQELWDEHFLLKELNSKSTMPYKYGKNSLEELVNEIKTLHLNAGNNVLNDKSEIVVTIGAVQALQAAMLFYKKQGKSEIFIPKPFWGRFKDFTDTYNLKIVDSPTTNSFSLITSPNNPNGEDQSQINADIRDACYNWHHYTDNVARFNDTINLYSLSKLSGHSSTRIGWAIVNNPEMAKFFKEFINIYTSGISIESQITAYEILKIINKNPKLLLKAKETLVMRKKKNEQVILENNLPINNLSINGMFMYVETKLDLISLIQISCIKGEDFFDLESNRYRLNIGVNQTDFEEFIKRLSKI